MTPRRMLAISCLDIRAAWLLMRLGRFVYRSSPHCSFVQFVHDLCLRGTHDETALRSPASFRCASPNMLRIPRWLIKNIFAFQICFQTSRAPRFGLSPPHAPARERRLMTIQRFSFDTESLWSLIQIANQVSLWAKMSSSKRTSLSSPARESDTRSVSVCSQRIRTFPLPVAAEF